MGSNRSWLRGDWIQTYSGRAFYPLAPYPQDVCIEDIAHALSQLCRFGGHCRRFYSVAEHSVLLSRAVVPGFQMWALLHDASEAYVVDVPRPIKKQLPAYVEAERRVMAAICARFDLDPQEPWAVKNADTRILADEAQQLMAPPPMPWSGECNPLGVTLEFMSPEEAKRAFLERFETLMQERLSLASRETGGVNG